jgi:hypothetical protein
MILSAPSRRPQRSRFHASFPEEGAEVSQGCACKFMTARRAFVDQLVCIFGTDANDIDDVRFTDVCVVQDWIS